MHEAAHQILATTFHRSFTYQKKFSVKIKLNVEFKIIKTKFVIIIT